jgi:hypothetical protein
MTNAEATIAENAATVADRACTSRRMDRHAPTKRRKDSQR